jgi:2-polyprenyl-3-methyl-5-hydroxy-6-metoxy-1,4-benzoquinol methylase
MKQFFRKLKRRLFPVYPSPLKYWEKRHAKFGTILTGPGCGELDQEANQTDYEAKWSHIKGALLSNAAPRPGTSLLDAGCGPGVFTERFVSLGYLVSAVDFAHNAVEIAKGRIGSAVTWYVDSLSGFAPGRTFDIVVCIDVLFHVTDDKHFQQALSNLASLVTLGGILIIQDHLIPETDVLATYSPRETHVRWRSLERYRSILAPEWHLITQEHYALPMEKDTKDLLVFTDRPAIK